MAISISLSPAALRIFVFFVSFVVKKLLPYLDRSFLCNPAAHAGIFAS
jgi:hypothetical protein